jgi:hypothetical protein
MVAASKVAVVLELVRFRSFASFVQTFFCFSKVLALLGGLFASLTFGILLTLSRTKDTTHLSRTISTSRDLSIIHYVIVVA